MADSLHRLAAERVADLLLQCLAILSFDAVKLDFDQFVRGQRTVDFLQYRCGEAVVADADRRMQVMRLGAQRAASGWR